MRLLYVSPYGFDDRLRNFPEFVLARAFARRGWEVRAVTLDDTGRGPREETVEGIRVLRLPGPFGPPGRGAAARLRGLFGALRARPDLVHLFHLRNPLAFFTAELARVQGIPLVFSEPGLLHDPYLVADREDPLARPLSPSAVCLWPRDLLRRRAGPPLRRLQSFLYHRPLALADRLVFLSRHNLEIASALGLEGATWLPCVTDDDRWSERAAGVLSEGRRDPPPSDPFVLWVGQWKRRKGWDLLLEAIPRLPRRRFERFVFVSPTFAETPPEFFRAARALGVEDRVTYLARVPNSVLLQHYRAARAVAVPSRYEGFGLPVLEAFAAGRPTVAANVVALNEILRDGENGCLFERNDPSGLAAALCRVLEDPELAERLVRGGHETLAEYRVERHLPAWERVYDEARRSRAARAGQRAPSSPQGGFASRVR
jgi:glycosyltransferase involved in cell wall biosynthesis